MKLSLRERTIFEFMKDRMSQDILIDDIINHLNLDPADFNIRVSVNGSIKMLGYKLSSNGYSIERRSKLGRNAPAYYCLNKHKILWPAGSPEDPE